MILADEGLNVKIIQHLRSAGYSVEWIQELQSGLDDEKIINLAKNKKQILITEDKDFGEWVFAHNVKGLTVIFLRYEREDFPIILSFLKSVLDSIIPLKEHEFITINKNKIRRRKI